MFGKVSYRAIQLKPKDWVLSQTSASDTLLTESWRTKEKLVLRKAPWNRGWLSEMLAISLTSSGNLSCPALKDGAVLAPPGAHPEDRVDLWVECQCPGVNVPISTDNKASGRTGEASDQQSCAGRWSLLSSP